MKRTDSRTSFAAKNIVLNIANKGLVSLLKFASRILFVRILGETMLGVSGLFSNVLGMLALAELGIGTAINYSLYQPIADQNTEKIRALMRFYQKAYRIISAVIFALGLLMMPFLPYLVRKDPGINHFYLIYFLFLTNMAVEYLFSYKRALATAAQQAYVIVPYTMAFEILICLLQIGVLLALRSSPLCYLSYLAVQTLCIVAENIVINRFLDRRYPILKSIRGAGKLDTEEKKSITVNIRALMYHKIGSYVVTGTDNILISMMIDLVTVGYYNNYSSLILTISGLVYLFVGNVTASFGNLIVKEKPQKRLAVFREMLLFYYLIYGVCAALFITLFSPFIGFVYGERFVLSMGVVVLVVLANFYLLGMTYVLDVVKSAAGLYDLDKWVPLIQAAVNLLVSIVLGKFIGLAGIFIGTLVSTLIPLAVKPVIIYKYVFEESPREYFLQLLYQLLVCGGFSFLSWKLCHWVQFSEPMAQIVFNLCATGITALAVFSLFNFRDPNFAPLVRRATRLVRRRR